MLLSGKLYILVGWYKYIRYYVVYSASFKIIFGAAQSFHTHVRECYFSQKSKINICARKISIDVVTFHLQGPFLPFITHRKITLKRGGGFILVIALCLTSICTPCIGNLLNC